MTDSSTITDWISAVSGILALSAAVLAAYYAKRTWETEHQRDLAREKEVLASQASKVVALPVVGQAWAGTSEFEGFRFPTPAVRILNNSDLPVYDLQVDHPLPKFPTNDNPTEINRDGCYWLGVAPPGQTDLNVGYPDIEDDLISDHFKSKVREGVRIDDDDELGPIYSEWITAGRPAFRFTDAAGNRWRRSRSGELTSSE